METQGLLPSSQDPATGPQFRGPVQQFVLPSWCTILFEKPIVAQLMKKYPFFMESEGSSPCSQKPANSLSRAS
jgi:hypothetical protein